MQILSTVVSKKENFCKIGFKTTITKPRPMITVLCIKTEPVGFGLFSGVKKKGGANIDMDISKRTDS